MSTSSNENRSNLMLDGSKNIINPDRKYTRFVSLMKSGLLVTAFGLSLVLIVWIMSSPEKDNVQISFSNLQSSENKNEGMINGQFVGQDSKKQPYIITSSFAKPVNGNPDIFALETLQADVTLNEGTWLTLLSPSALFDRNKNKLYLDKSVYIYADNGLEINTSTAKLDLKEGVVSGKNLLQATSPYGTLTANTFVFHKNEEKIFFSGNVKVVLNRNRSR